MSGVVDEGQKAQMETDIVPPAKLIRSAPNALNAVNLFAGKWACDLRELDATLVSGTAPLFVVDARPRELEAELNATGRTIKGSRVLEIGPLEGAHTFQLERLGAASVLAIESNSEAFLKCLVVKEIAGLVASRFLLGDIHEYLSSTEQRYDIVFCCGVLYHMADPFVLLKQASNVTDIIFIWTHYADERFQSQSPDGQRVAKSVEREGLQLSYYQRKYVEMNSDLFLGGNEALSSWMPLDDLLASLDHLGFDVRMIKDDPAHPNGPAVTLVAIRRDTATSTSLA